MKEMVSYKDLCDMEFPEGQARRIIRIAKKELVANGLAFYNGKRVGIVPGTVVQRIIGIQEQG